MEKIMNKKFGILIGVAGLLIIMISLVNAFGVSTSYWGDNPLKIAPGESKIVVLGLQNKVGTEDMTLKANLTNDGEGIATLVDENLEYLVPIGGGNEVTIQIKVPEDADKGITHTITVSFTQIAPEGEGGMVRLTGGIVSKFPVEIVGEKESELYNPEAKKGLSGFWMFIIVIAVIVIVLTVLAIAKRRKIKKK